VGQTSSKAIATLPIDKGDGSRSSVEMTSVSAGE
jgi:hypothetical protein